MLLTCGGSFVQNCSTNIKLLQTMMLHHHQVRSQPRLVMEAAAPCRTRSRRIRDHVGPVKSQSSMTPVAQVSPPCGLTDEEQGLNDNASAAQQPAVICHIVLTSLQCISVTALCCRSWRPDWYTTRSCEERKV